MHCHAHTATPSKPREVKGLNITSVTFVGGSIVSVNWVSPKKQHEREIDYYELTLKGFKTNSTTFKVDAASSLPYYLNVTHDNYTVSVTAVDVCGQRSEPSEFVNFTSAGSKDPSFKQQKLQSEVNNLKDERTKTLAVCVVLIVIFAGGLVIAVGYIIYKYKKKTMHKFQHNSTNGQQKNNQQKDDPQEGGQPEDAAQHN